MPLGVYDDFSRDFNGECVKLFLCLYTCDTLTVTSTVCDLYSAQISYEGCDDVIIYSSKMASFRGANSVRFVCFVLRTTFLLTTCRFIDLHPINIFSSRFSSSLLLK